MDQSLRFDSPVGFGTFDYLVAGYTGQMKHDLRELGGNFVDIYDYAVKGVIEGPLL